MGDNKDGGSEFERVSTLVYPRMRPRPPQPHATHMVPVAWSSTSPCAPPDGLSVSTTRPSADRYDGGSKGAAGYTSSPSRITAPGASTDGAGVYTWANLQVVVAVGLRVRAREEVQD